MYDLNWSEDSFDITREQKLKDVHVVSISDVQYSLEVIRTFDNGRFKHIASKIQIFLDLKERVLLGKYLNSLIMDVEGDDPKKGNGKRGYPFRKGFPQEVMKEILNIYNIEASVDSTDFAKSIWAK